MTFLISNQLKTGDLKLLPSGIFGTGAAYHPACELKYTTVKPTHKLALSS
jgi:hypothetical protein